MFECLKCGNAVRVTHCQCEKCGIGFDAVFETPRLARLSLEEQSLVEALVLNGGNLSRMTDALQTSYPTLRKRMDRLIERLTEMRRADARCVETMLKAVERGELAPEAAARRIEEMGGDA